MTWQRAKLAIFTAMQLIDTHTHLYAKEFDDDRTEKIKEAMDAGIVKFLLPHIDSEWTQPMLDLADELPQNCIPMMGLHPCSVKEDYREELKHAEEQLSLRKYIAIGEMGIDLYWDKTFIKEQDEAFTIQCNWAQQLNLPIAIHSREATDHVIRLIHKNNIPGLKGVFHCFSGNIDEANEIKKMGFMLGIGGVSTFKNGGLDKILPSIAISNIILETDAPYLAPVPHRGKRNDPAYLKLIAQRVADIYQLSLTELASVTTQNAVNLFGSKLL